MTPKNSKTTEMESMPLSKPAWVRNAETEKYFYEEWGSVEISQTALFEQLCLLTFQLGLTFQTVLKKRDGLREVLSSFEIEKVALLTDEDLHRACDRPDIIRNFNKLKACRDNARVLVEHSISLPELFHQNFKEIQVVERFDALPKTTEESEQLHRILSQLGTKYWGPSVLCSVAQSCGLITASSRCTFD